MLNLKKWIASFIAQLKDRMSTGMLVLMTGSFICYVSLTFCSFSKSRKVDHPGIQAILIQNEKHDIKIPISGRIKPAQPLDVTAQLPGTLSFTEKKMQSGGHVQKGQILFVIDNKELQLEFLSKKAQLMEEIAQYLTNIKTDNKSSAWTEILNSTTMRELSFPDLTPSCIKEAQAQNKFSMLAHYYALKANEEKLSKATIRSPFDGQLKEILVNTGSPVQEGQCVASLVQDNASQLQVGLKISELNLIGVGSKVELFTDIRAEHWTGEIEMVHIPTDSIESGFAVISVRNANLTQDTWVSGNILGKEVGVCAQIPDAWIFNNQYVYGVSQNMLVKYNVQIFHRSETMALVGGINNRLLIVQPFLKIHEGMPCPSLNVVTIDEASKTL